MKLNRDLVARIVCFWDPSGTCHDAYCGSRCMAVRPDEIHYRAADAIMAVERAPEPAEPA